LAVAGSAPLPLNASLGESGVIDGQVLYLRDVASDPGADMVVEDIDELIAGEAEQHRRRSWPSAFVVISFGLVWMVAAAGLAVRQSGAGLITAAVSLVVAGLLLLATGWALAQRQVPAPPVLFVLTSLTAVPCMAVAGALLAQALAGPSFLWVGAIAGATAAALMSLAATPEALVAMVGLQLSVALLVAPLLMAVHANGVQVAAATVVASLSVLGMTKLAAALVTVWSHRMPEDDASMGNVATTLLIRSRRVLTVLVSGPALALTISLPVLALSGGGFGIAMAGVASIALLVRAQQVGFANEIVLIGGAGLVGLFALVAALAQRVWGTGVAGIVVLIVAGLALIAGGMVAAVLRADGEAPSDMPPGFPPGAGRKDRRRFIDIIGVLCTIATASLALGVFGVSMTSWHAG
jgi:hypothetical protein